MSYHYPVLPYNSDYYIYTKSTRPGNYVITPFALIGVVLSHPSGLITLDLDRLMF